MSEEVFRVAKFTNNIYHFPESSPLKDKRYIYVPGQTMPISDYPHDQRILLFQKPQLSQHVIPIYCLDHFVRKIKLEELERLVKEQTGKSVAEITIQETATDP